MQYIWRIFIAFSTFLPTFSTPSPLNALPSIPHPNPLIKNFINSKTQFAQKLSKGSKQPHPLLFICLLINQ
jgi:hypothetical protein